MSNGKRWTIYVCPGPDCDEWVKEPEWEAEPGWDGDRAQPLEELCGFEHGYPDAVEVMPVSEHNADLESLAQELERRARCAKANEDSYVVRGATADAAAEGGAAQAFEEAAQLVRAEIEGGEARG